MAARILSPALRQAFERLYQADGACAELAAAVNSCDTLVLALPFVTGGLTLNALNLIAVESSLCDSEQPEVLVCLLEHECSHIQQAHLVDSIQQELTACQAAARVAEALYLTQEKERHGYALTLDEAKLEDLEKARNWILSSPDHLHRRRQSTAGCPCINRREYC